MGRTESIYPSEVLTALENSGGQATRQDVAAALGCSTGTITRKVASLIKSGENIGFDVKGLFIQNVEDVANQEGYDRASAWTQRVVNSLIMWAKRGNNHKPVAIAARKQFAKELTVNERKMLKSNLLLISRVVDAVDLDEELGNP